MIQAGSYNNNYRWIEVISFFTICYMGLCTFYTVFRVRVLNYYYLLPGNSDSYTLLFSALLLSRLTGPMCLNFLSIIHMDTHVILSFSPSFTWWLIVGAPWQQGLEVGDVLPGPVKLLVAGNLQLPWGYHWLQELF